MSAIDFNTNRLNICGLHINDDEFFMQLVNTPGWLKFIGNRKVADRLTATAHIEKILNDKSYSYNVIRLKDLHQPIGVITFIKRSDYSAPDIGFALLPQFERKGYAYEAASAFLEMKKKENSEILGITRNDNNTSIRLLRKLGLNYKCSKKENRHIILIYTTATGA